MMIQACQQVIFRYMHKRNTRKEVIYMLATLQSVLKFILTFSSVLGIAFMILCTAFVVVSLIRGDIKIGMVKDETEKEEK